MGSRNLKVGRVWGVRVSLFEFGVTKFLLFHVSLCVTTTHHRLWECLCYVSTCFNLFQLVSTCFNLHCLLFQHCLLFHLFITVTYTQTVLLYYITLQCVKISCAVY